MLRTFKISLRNSWENLWNSSQEIPRYWFWDTFRWKFPRISTNFVNIFSGFSTELVTRNSLDRVMRISSEWVKRNSLDLVPQNGLQEVSQNSCGHFLMIFLLNFCWNFPASQERFLGNSEDFLQNCYLGHISINLLYKKLKIHKLIKLKISTDFLIFTELKNNLSRK